MVPTLKADHRDVTNAHINGHMKLKEDAAPQFTPEMTNGVDASFVAAVWLKSLLAECSSNCLQTISAAWEEAMSCWKDQPPAVMMVYCGIKVSLTDLCSNQAPQVYYIIFGMMVAHPESTIMSV